MAWKKMLALVTGQIEESLRRKLEFVLEENLTWGYDRIAGALVNLG